MRKIMLVIDDFNDLLGFEAFFRRLGFDVLSLGKDILVGDALLGFVPDFVVATGKGRMVDGLKLAVRLSQQNVPPKIALIFGAGAPAQLSAEVRAAADLVIEIPFQPILFLRSVAEMLKLDEFALIEKFEKQRTAKLQILDDRQLFVDGNGQRSGIQIIKGRGAEPDLPLSSSVNSVTGGASQASVSKLPPLSPPSEREDRYAKFLAEHNDDVSRTISHQDLMAAGRKLKKDSASELERLEKLDAQKREFVKALFSQDPEVKEAGVEPKLGSVASGQSDPEN